MNAGADLASEASHHLEANTVSNQLVDFGRIGEPVVRIEDLRLVHPNAVVDHRNRHDAVLHRRGQRHQTGLRRVTGCVLHQFCKQVARIDGKGAAHGQVTRDIADHHTVQVRHFRCSRPKYVVQRYRFAPTAGLLLARQDQQVFRIAAHAGHQVVDLVQRFERVGIFLVRFQTIHDLQLPVNQRLIAPTKVHQHGGHRLRPLM